MIIFFRGLFLLPCFLLISCKSTFMLPPHSPLALCIASCERGLEVCQHECGNNCANCLRFDRQKAMKNYSAYVQEQHRRGSMVIRGWQSYLDPLQCRKVTCSCNADYHVCMQACGVTITKKLRPAPICQARLINEEDLYGL